MTASTAGEAKFPQAVEVSPKIRAAKEKYALETDEKVQALVVQREQALGDGE